ncbi:uncharacterized protein LOC132275933 isoform X1 [Cornus florida]|uniref:uncharacterized protein LOC132275933 isoform X1 n=1 Tax=Cornus florida TaxID=4283 RepID=UPI0028A16075|nr:uncharacterized protein LOC132275933 isoform X1 [Cornus florida]
MMLMMSTSSFPPLLSLKRNLTTTNTAPSLHQPDISRRRRRTPQNLTTMEMVSSDNQAVVVTASADDDESPLVSSSSSSASDVVKNFYRGINGHDLASVEDLIAHNCVYEDLIFPQPFVGRKFVIDDLSNEDTSAVGVKWHLEWKGKPFPFSRGCSFYRLNVVNGKRQIIYGRDSVEPAIKPGEAALVVTRLRPDDPLDELCGGSGLGACPQGKFFNRFSLVGHGP